MRKMDSPKAEEVRGLSELNIGCYVTGTLGQHALRGRARPVKRQEWGSISCLVRMPVCREVVGH